ncbi:MAG: YCF48-related protein [Marinilabiliales bacterium]|nr:YCF48-related protein [Marinilabiliales bacterium]
MYKFVIVLLTAFLLCGCNEVPDNPEDDLTIDLDGWEISKSTYDFDINPRDMYFVDENIGFVVGYNGNIYKTTDSGTTWRKLNSGTILHLLSVYFIDENVGFVSGQAASGCLDADCDKGSVFLKTTDGGDTWTKTFIPEFIRISVIEVFRSPEWNCNHS